MLAMVVSVLIIMSVNLTEPKEKKCPRWRHHYLDISLQGEESCKPCTQCKPGYKQVTHCTRVADTYCVPCRWGTYSSSNAKRCRPCKHCQQGAKIRGKCTNIEKRQCECLEGRYYKRGKCVPCTECPAGTYVMSQCAFRRDTQCRKCPERTFTTSTSKEPRYCAKCSDCRFGELIEQECNSTHDTVCGECKPGMFRLTSSHECGQCSLCYPDANGSYANAIIIDECRRRNPDQSRICMPSVTTLPNYVTNDTGYFETTVLSIVGEVGAKIQTGKRLFEGNDGELALFIVACIVISLVCLVLIGLGLIYISRNSVKCVKVYRQQQNTKPYVSKSILEDYLQDQRSSQPYCLARSNSALLSGSNTHNNLSKGTSISLETGLLQYLRTEEFHPHFTDFTWTFGPPSGSSYSDIFSVSATGTLSSNKGEKSKKS